MKPLLLCLLILFGCGKPSDHQQPATENDAAGPIEALYDQAWSAHDEVMPKLDEIMQLKRELQDKISKSPDMVAARKKDLERIISNLDSAHQEMMNWMHRMHAFNPQQDTLDQEKAREYLETEMEKIRKVSDLMNEAIEKAKASQAEKEL
jgi:Skp family chaperone for outer membrane proteins